MIGFPVYLCPTANLVPIVASFRQCSITALPQNFDPLATLKLLNDKELAKLYDAMCDRREAIDIGKRGAITHETSLNKKRYGEKLRGFFGAHSFVPR